MEPQGNRKVQKEVGRLVEKEKLARKSIRIHDTRSSSSANVEKCTEATRALKAVDSKEDGNSSIRRVPLSVQNRKSKLDTSQEAFTQATLLPCSQCPAQFTAQDFLKDHQRSVHGTRRLHKCDRCSKWFTQQKPLNELPPLQSHGVVPVDVQVTTASQVKCVGCMETFANLNGNETISLSDCSQVTQSFDAEVATSPDPLITQNGDGLDLNKNEVMMKVMPTSTIEQEVAEILLEMHHGPRKEKVNDFPATVNIVESTVPFAGVTAPSSSPSASATNMGSDDDKLELVVPENVSTPKAAVEVTNPPPPKKTGDECQCFRNSANDSPLLSRTLDDIARTLMNLQQLGRKESTKRVLDASFFLHMNRYDPDEV